MDPRQAVQILAIHPFWTQSPGKEEAKVGAWCAVTARVSRIARNIAARGSGGFGKVFVFAIAAGPFVVPDVEDCAGWGRGFGLESCGIDLRASGTALAPDDLLDLFAFGVGGYYCGFGGERGEVC